VSAKHDRTEIEGVKQTEHVGSLFLHGVALIRVVAQTAAA